MILFKRYHVQQILDGTKTETRRCWKNRKPRIHSVHLAKVTMLSKEFFARLLIENCYTQRLGDISEQEARAEGYGSREEYIAKFYEINKKKLRQLGIKEPEVVNLRVTAVKFKVIE
jgi:hypothetical protein